MRKGFEGLCYGYDIWQQFRESAASLEITPGPATTGTITPSVQTWSQNTIVATFFVSSDASGDFNVVVVSRGTMASGFQSVQGVTQNRSAPRSARSAISCDSFAFPLDTFHPVPIGNDDPAHLPVYNPAVMRASSTATFWANRSPANCTINWSVTGSQGAYLTPVPGQPNLIRVTTGPGTATITVTAQTPRPPASLPVVVPVVQEKVIPIRFVVVRDSSGNNAAATLARVQRDFETANKLWEQAVVRFEWANAPDGQPIRYVDNTEYLVADPFDRAELVDTYKDTGGFEAYYVSVCSQDTDGQHAGLRSQWGVFVCGDEASSRVLSHELGHSLIGLQHQGSSIYLMYSVDAHHSSDITPGEHSTMVTRAVYSHQ